VLTTTITTVVEGVVEREIRVKRRVSIVDLEEKFRGEERRG